MKNSLIVVSMVLIIAAHSGTAEAQAPSDAHAYNCAIACEQELGPSCHDRRTVVACLERQPECTGNSELINAAGMILFGRMTCPQLPDREPVRRRVRTRSVRQVPPAAVATSPTATTPVPQATESTVDPTGLTYVLPSMPILGEGPAATDGRARLAQQTCEALGGVWYAEGRTADPSRARIVALIQHLIESNAGPGGSPDDDRNPGVCLTPEGVIFAEVIRQVINEMRTGDAEQDQRLQELQAQLGQLQGLRDDLGALRERLALVDANSQERDLAITQLIRNWSRYFARAEALRRCRPGQASIEFTFDGQTERVPCQSPEARAEGVRIPQFEPRTGDTRSSARRLTGERLGLIAEGAFSMSRYQLVAHAGSRSPKFIGFGLGLTIRLVDHLYLAGVIDIGAGLRDGEHVPALFEAQYRAGVLGVAADHLLLGASAHFGHRYSGDGEFSEQSGTWYQLRQRGLRLDVGYLWRERGWSPFVTVGALLGVGCHADRRLSAGEECLFDPVGFITVGVMRPRAP